MSSDDFHAHGPHDHALEPHGSGDLFANKIAVMTAILATIGAIFSYRGGATQNQALLYKNEAAILKTEASNQWNYYQAKSQEPRAKSQEPRAKSQEQNLAELSVAIAPNKELQERYQTEIVRYRKEKEEIKQEAEAQEKLAQEADQKSEDQMHFHHRWAQAMTAIQIAISLSAITLLTRKKWLQWLAYGAAAGGTLLGMAAFFRL